MTQTEDRFWIALIAKLTQMRWGASPAFTAGLLPRDSMTDRCQPPAAWPGSRCRRTLAVTGPSRRIPG